MFGLFSGKKKKAAKELLAAAYKVYNYRRDVMSKNDADEMRSLMDALEEFFLEGKIGSVECEKTSERLEKLMRKTGGKIYPLSSLTDNVETVIVVGIIALGVRSFFFQPFKIPTNSMYPTFYGMTPYVYPAESASPNALEKVWRFVKLGASHYEILAPEDGEFLLEMNSPENPQKYSGMFSCDMEYSKILGVWPTAKRKYSLLYGQKNIDIETPADFPIDSVIMHTFGMVESDDMGSFWESCREKGRVIKKGGRLFLKIGNFKKGERVLGFDILTGDMLFADRVTYNFRKPKVGESIVFMTRYCEGMTLRNGGIPDDKYYIKRLVGEGGDVLEVKNSTLYRNGNPIEGAEAFEKNAMQAGLYKGYKNEGELQEGSSVKVLPKHYYAMGDNSANSLDSRFWGQMPQKALVGKSIIISYPFTARWGPSK